MKHSEFLYESYSSQVPPTALTVKKYIPFQRPPPIVIKYIVLQRLLPSSPLLSLSKYIALQRDTEFMQHGTWILMVQIQLPTKTLSKDSE